MAKIMKASTKRFTAWSYSRLSTYRDCPFKAKCKFLDKLKEPEGPALAHGSEIHKLAEGFLKGEIKRLPTELKTLGKEFKDLKKLEVGTEEQWAFRQDWKTCDWFAVDCWLRIIVDAYAKTDVHTLVIVDHKTGRIYPEKQDQLNLYGLGGLLMYPEVNTVKTAFWYIDHNTVKEETVTRDQLPDIKKHWNKEVKAMMLDTTFAPRPNDKCRWCHFRKSNGGPCKF